MHYSKTAEGLIFFFSVQILKAFFARIHTESVQEELLFGIEMANNCIHNVFTKHILPCFSKKQMYSIIDLKIKQSQEGENCPWATAVKYTKESDVQCPNTSCLDV